MDSQKLRLRIAALEASISLATADVIEGRQLYADTVQPMTSAPALHQDPQHHKQDFLNTPGVPDMFFRKIDKEATHEINILTRPLKSLTYAKTAIPSQLYPTFSVKYGITHWAVEVNGRVFEVRTEGWKGSGDKMRIREEDSMSSQYLSQDVDRFPIGVGPYNSVDLFRQMSELAS